MRDLAPDVRAEHGRIFDGHGDDEREYDPTGAREHAAKLIAAAVECERQQELIRAACAGGHLWGAGMNGVKLGDGAKVTVQHCERDGCGGYQELPGWIEFAEQLHICPHTGRQLSCYGPGCDYCAAARLGEAIRDMLADAYARLVGELEPVGVVPPAFAANTSDQHRNDNAGTSDSNGES